MGTARTSACEHPHMLTQLPLLATAHRSRYSDKLLPAPGCQRIKLSCALVKTHWSSTSLMVSGAALALALLWPAPSHPAPSLWYKAKETQGQAMLEGLTPASSSHQAQGYTPGCSQGAFLPPLPSAGHMASGASSTVCVFPLPFPLSQASAGLLHVKSAMLRLSKPFTTDTSSSLTSGILLPAARSSHPGWPHLEGDRDFPDPTETFQHPAPMTETQALATSNRVQNVCSRQPMSPA